MSSSPCISTVIKNDHITVNQLYKNYLMAEGNVDDQQHWANQFQVELTRHNTAEELVLYPAFEQYLGVEGKKMADRHRAKHQNMKNLLYLLQTTSVSDPQYRSAFTELMVNLNEHVKREENHDLSKFENAITPDVNASLVRSFKQAKMSAPIQAYANSPVNPPL